MTDQAELKAFVDRMPKVELHAHLNGCIRESTIFELAKERGIVLSEHHFGDNEATTGDDDNNCHMFNSKPRSLMDCFDMFAQVTQVVADLPALRRITLEALEDFAAHHVVYLELRSTPKRLKTEWKSELIASKRDYVQTILNVFKEFERTDQERYIQESAENEECRLPLTVRLIVSIDRAKTEEEAMENVDLAIDFHESNDHYVVGIDMGGNPLKNDFRNFQASLTKARAAGLKLTLHCGEVPCAEDNQDDDTSRVKALEEAKALIVFKPDRLGHALLLPQSLQPELMKARIPVECCPTSNVMTLELASNHHGYLVEGLRSHPQIKFWLTENYPFSISTDDSGVFNTSPSKELLLLATAWSIDREHLGQIALNSIDHAFCDNGLKSLIRERISVYFTECLKQ